MSLVLVSSKRFVDHVTPVGHPERPERAEVLQAVAAAFKEQGGEVIEPRLATDDDLLRVHTQEHVDAIVATRGKATMIDEDTFTSPDSDEIARLAAGAVLTGVDRVLDGATGSRALALVRPPGHHAEADRAMGFCLYNNIAVGAAYARSRGCARVAIVDYDVHHGNGTQWIFYEDPTVLFVSSHQCPFYPGTGAASETGRGAGTRLHAQHSARGRRQRRRDRTRVRRAGDSGGARLQARSADDLRRLRCARTGSARAAADDDRRLWPVDEDAVGAGR